MDNIEVVFGTYENLILGYKVIKNLNGSNGLETSFTDDSHRGALRCLSVSSSGMLASSSTDDSIRLHSLKKRKEIGGLFEHRGTVNCVTFFKGSHMFSASEDGTICMWKSKNWELLRTLKGHKSHVMAVAIHPSGKLGLSVGNDKSFLTWDLVTGKLAFQRKIKEVAQSMLFTSDGDHYILVYNKQIEVCSLEDTKTVQEIPFDWRINAVCFVEGNILAVGGDDSNVLLVDILTGKQLLTLDMTKPEDGSFSSRVRCISVLECNGDKLVLVATASGNLKVFCLNLKEKEARMLLFYETRVRVTCMTVYCPAEESQSEDAAQSKVKKPKQREEIATEEPQRKRKVAMNIPEENTTSEEDNEKDDSNDDVDSDEGNMSIDTQGSQKKGKKRKLDGKTPKQSQGKKQKVSRHDEDDDDDNESFDEEGDDEIQTSRVSKQRSVNQQLSRPQKKKQKRKQPVNKDMKKNGATEKKSMKSSSKRMKMKEKKKKRKMAVK